MPQGGSIGAKVGPARDTLTRSPLSDQGHLPVVLVRERDQSRGVVTMSRVPAAIATAGQDSDPRRRRLQRDIIERGRVLTQPDPLRTGGGRRPLDAPSSGTDAPGRVLAAGVCAGILAVSRSEKLDRAAASRSPAGRDGGDRGDSRASTMFFLARDRHRPEWQSSSVSSAMMIRSSVNLKQTASASSKPVAILSRRKGRARPFRMMVMLARITAWRRLGTDVTVHAIVRP